MSSQMVEVDFNRAQRFHQNEWRPNQIFIFMRDSARIQEMWIIFRDICNNYNRKNSQIRGKQITIKPNEQNEKLRERKLSAFLCLNNLNHLRLAFDEYNDKTNSLEWKRKVRNETLNFELLIFFFVLCPLLSSSPLKRGFDKNTICTFQFDQMHTFCICVD